MSSDESRLHVVDALRGFSIVSIMLLHNLEHFNFYYFPTNLPAWMTILDKEIWKGIFFIFGGKSYAIFALLFGLTFFIQTRNQEKKGKDFRGRFAWRLALLLAFGLFNSLFFQGDILSVYALIGIFLITVVKLSNKVVCCLALIFMLQPYEWINFFIALQHPDVMPGPPVSYFYLEKMAQYIPNGSLVQTMIGNITNGKEAVFHVTLENGRFSQTLSLFMLGMLAGRKSLFVISNDNKRIWARVLIISSIAFVPLYGTTEVVPQFIHSKAMLRSLLVIGTCWSNMAFMVAMVSGFILLFQTGFFHRILTIFSPIGRMSMTNYIMQSIIGSCIYYGFGFGLYKYTGATYCLLIGAGFAILQGYFSFWWMTRHKQGPLETIWHKATWIGSKT